MTKLRLISLFSMATLICMAAFTTVVYHSHVEDANIRDFNYLKLYTERVNETRKQNKNVKEIPIPYHIVHNNSYQVVVVGKYEQIDFMHKTEPLFKQVNVLFPFLSVIRQNATSGHVLLNNQEVHWVKFELHHPDEHILFIHSDSDHWKEFIRSFGLAIAILSMLFLWAAIWSAIILSNLFQRMYDNNKLLQQQALEIGKARDEAYAATKAKSRFLANMSHELRTPLTAILGFSESMLDANNLSESQSKPLRTIIRNGNHLLHIINELLDLSKIENNKLAVEKIPFSPIQLIQDIESLMSHQAEEKNLKLLVNYNWPLPAIIKNDPFRLKQVMLNLVSNAIKFTDHGYVHINVSCQKENQLLSIEVIDSGIGIAPENQENIFQDFVQADISTTRQYGGTGLGLSLSKQLVELMGGTIGLSSKLNHGSRFHLNIQTGPLSDIEFVVNLDKYRSFKTVDTKQDYRQLKGHILAADDAPDNRLLLSVLLNKIGLEVTSVENGALALEMAKENDFDLVILDIQMPVLDGVETVTKLRESDFNKPVIALTANTLQEDRALYESAGFTDFISKPIRYRMLYKILSQFLEKTA